MHAGPARRTYAGGWRTTSPASSPGSACASISTWGFWYDRNVGNAAEVATVEFPFLPGLRFRLNDRPVGAWVARTGARLRWREPVTADGRRVGRDERLGGAEHGDLGATEYNRTWLSMSAGPRLGYAVPFSGRLQPGLLAADIGMERRWRGGSGHAINLWAGLGLNQALDRGLAGRRRAPYLDHPP